MEDYIKISTLNDFIFCPKSIYFHELYNNFNEKFYHKKEQISGTIAHTNIDEKKYSSRKNILQAIDIYSEYYGIAGKIDLYDKKKEKLIERKNKVTKIYYGYKLQVRAQYLCLQDMGYHVQEIVIHSLKDNKNYPIKIPKIREISSLENYLEKYRKFDIYDKNFIQNKNKCKKCIYKELCDYYKDTSDINQIKIKF